MMPYLLIACLLLAGCAGVAAPPRQTVPAVSLDRYLGTWYEIARFDHRFERGLSAVTATYTLRPDGRIDVLNAGTTAAGKRKTAHGVARIPRAEEPGRLQVTFFLWFWADYLILDLAPDYRYALVGSRADGYLWVLSRTPQMAPADYTHLLRRATERGYDTGKLMLVPQP